MKVRLKTIEWRNEIEKELNLCSSNTSALYNQFSNSLLGDDFSVPSMEFDMGEGTCCFSFASVSESLKSTFLVMII